MNRSLNMIALALSLVTLLIGTGCKAKQQPLMYTSTLEATKLHVPSLNGGIIQKLLVQEGDWVNIGDTLAVMDSREIGYSIEQIDASLQELNMQIAIAKTNQTQADTDVAYVQERTDRLDRLYKSDVVTKQNLDDALNLETKSKTLTQNASSQAQMLAATREKLLAQKKILLKKLHDGIIYSPLSGKVTTLYYQGGEAIPPFANLVEIINAKSLDTDVYVSETMLAKLKTGQTATIKTESGIKFTGKINIISSKAEFTPKTILTPDTRAGMVYAVTIKVDNPDDVLKDGMPVEVEF